MINYADEPVTTTLALTDLAEWERAYHLHDEQDYLTDTPNEVVLAPQDILVLTQPNVTQTP